MADGLVVQAIEGLLPVRDEREPLRVLIASLAPGGAERIVLEWLAVEIARGRGAELAVLHRRRTGLAPPAGVRLRMRGRESPEAFLRALAGSWRGARAPVSTHLIGDEHLALLWEAGLRTVPVVHNARAGWRNDPSRWDPRNVPQAIACADAVRREMLAAGCRVPVTTVRHRPRVGPGATDPALRRAIREELRVGEGTLLVAAIGAIKAQKDHARAVEVIAALARRRDAVLVILGGMLEPAAAAELNRLLDAAVRLGVTDRLRLPGFVADIEPWLAACDALLNVSRFEGLSMATREALAAGLPVVSADVGGQREIAEKGLELVAADAAAEEFAARLARHPVRAALVRKTAIRVPCTWSIAIAARERAGPALETLFVTANLNAGGAQRSLVNLVRTIVGRHEFEIAVCGESTQGAFAAELRSAGIVTFRPAPDADAFAVAESLLAHAQERGARNLCFWNVDPKVKLLVAKFAPDSLRLVDVSPGAYAFEELAAAADFGEAIAFDVEAFHARVDVLVLKFASASHPACRRVEVVENGVAGRDLPWRVPRVPRFLVSGRIAPSKRLDTVLRAFARVCRDHSDAELHIVGSAEPRHAQFAARIMARARPLPVRFHGACAALTHLDEAYTAAIVLGTHQGSPNSVLEAMAARVPVIANASGGTAAMLESGAGWLLAEDASTGALCAAMLEAIRSPAQARQFAECAWVRARERYGLERMAARYLALLGADPAPVREKMQEWKVAPPITLAPGKA